MADQNLTGNQASDGSSGNSDDLLPPDIRDRDKEERFSFLPVIYKAGWSWRKMRDALDLNAGEIRQAMAQYNVEPNRGKGYWKGSPHEPPPEQLPLIPPNPVGRPPKSTQSKPYEQPLKTLDESYSNVIKHVTSRIDWFINALSVMNVDDLRRFVLANTVSELQLAAMLLQGTGAGKK